VDREHQSNQPPGTARTVPAKEAQPKSKPRARTPKDAGKSTAGTSAPDIMSRLPKTRPQRASERRRTTAAEAPKRSGSSSAARKPPTAAKRTAAAPRKRAAAAPVAAGSPPRVAAAKTGSSQSEAASLPRLAVDGATEAVKLPLKVGGRLTLRALDAVARSLRRC
jgi:hypothetical protein